MQDVARRFWRGAKQLAIEVQFGDERFQRSGAEKTLRSYVEAEAVFFDRVDDAAEARAAFDE